MRGASVSQITRELRAAHGRAYRRADLLSDVRSYRNTALDTASNAMETASAAIESAITTTYRDLRGFIARIGIAAFSISLILPTLVHGGATSHVMIASSLDQVIVPSAERIALPNARESRRIPVAEASIDDMLIQPDPVPEQAKPASAPPSAPVYAALPTGVDGVVVTASWYGPGFYDNRLPCWQWLKANGLPIQFEADTWGVAHKTLPCGTMLTLSHGTSVITVPVVDRGPYVGGRELDLSLRVKTALGCTDLCTVVMHIGQ